MTLARPRTKAQGLRLQADLATLLAAGRICVVLATKFFWVFLEDVITIRGGGRFELDTNSINYNLPYSDSLLFTLSSFNRSIDFPEVWLITESIQEVS